MSNLIKVTFPACATCGPMMVAFGTISPNRDGMYFGFVFAILGAFLTTAALLMVFSTLKSLETSTTSVEQSVKSNSRDAA